MIECHVIDLLKEKNLRNLPKVDLALTMIPKNPIPTNDPLEKLHYIEAMDEFHGKLVDSIENEILNRFYGIIKFNICRYHYWLRFLRLPDSLHPNMVKSLTQEHSKILDLIKRGEFDEAKDCLKSHMDGTWRLMKKYLLKTSSENCETLI
jgi:DNA-binding GntR family transcriptional regulator